MLSDLDERELWLFALPEATAYVPALSEADARVNLVRSSYEGALVASWPLIATHVCSPGRR